MMAEEKIAPIAVSQVYKPADTMSASGTFSSVDNISKLFSLVKQYDFSFNQRKDMVQITGRKKRI